MERLTLAVLDDQLSIKLTQDPDMPEDLEVVWVGQSADAMMDALPELRPRVLVLQLEHLGHNPITRAQLLARLAHAELTIVTYAFARRDVIEALREESVQPVRVPLTSRELRAHLTGVIMRSLTAEERVHAEGSNPTESGATKSGATEGLPTEGSPTKSSPSDAIQPPRYSLATLAKLESISTSVYCECPQHLSSLLSSLAYFESYCQDCENRDEGDAALHRMLYEHTARARMLLEQALQQTLDHEKLTI